MQSPHIQHVTAMLFLNNPLRISIDGDSLVGFSAKGKVGLSKSMVAVIFVVLVILAAAVFIIYSMNRGAGVVPQTSAVTAGKAVSTPPTQAPG